MLKRLKMITRFLTSKDCADSLEELLLYELFFFNVTLIDDDPVNPTDTDAFEECGLCSSF